jgi:hypothetical protein
MSTIGAHVTKSLWTLVTPNRFGIFLGNKKERIMNFVNIKKLKFPLDE